MQFAGLKGVTYYVRVTGAAAQPPGAPLPGAVTSASPSINNYDVTVDQIDDLGPQVFDPDGPVFPATGNSDR